MGDGWRPSVGRSTVGEDTDVDESWLGERHPHFVTVLRKPIIAAINGACAGIGLTQALMCDIRFAAAGAKFTTAFARRGLIAEYGISWILPRVVGWGAAPTCFERPDVMPRRRRNSAWSRKWYRPTILPRALAYAEDMAGTARRVRWR